MLHLKGKLMKELMDELAGAEDKLAMADEPKEEQMEGECDSPEEEMMEQPKVQVKAMKIVAKPEMEDEFEPDDSKDDERKPKYKDEDYPFFPKKKK